jgi:hypothetical protein
LSTYTRDEIGWMALMWCLLVMRWLAIIGFGIVVITLLDMAWIYLQLSMENDEPGEVWMAVWLMVCSIIGALAVWHCIWRYVRE